MDFLLGNHSSGSSNSDNLGESKENMKPPNEQKEENEALMHKKRKQEIVNENERGGEGADKKYPKSNSELQMLIEREKRKKMNEMFDVLCKLLPETSSKVDKATIVDETVNYIKVLEETREKLEKQKQERAQYALKEIMSTSNALSITGKQKVAFDKTWAASNMVLNIRGDEAQFSICSVHKPGLMTTIASVLEKHNIEVITASISCNDHGNGSTCMILVHAKHGSDANSAEETYRKAAEEIMPCVA